MSDSPCSQPASPTAVEIIEQAFAVTTMCLLSCDRDGLISSHRARPVSIDKAVVRLALSERAAGELSSNSIDPLEVTISLRVGSEDVVFFTRVLTVERDDNPDEAVLCLDVPREVISTRRRGRFRALVDGGDGVGLRLWRIDRNADLHAAPRPSQAFRGTIRDLSVGGVSAIVWANRVEAMRLSEGQRFRIAFQFGDEELVLDSRLRHPRETQRDQEFAICGFEFVFDERLFATRRDRQKLEALIATLQRRAASRQAAA